MRRSLCSCPSGAGRGTAAAAVRWRSCWALALLLVAAGRPAQLPAQSTGWADAPPLECCLVLLLPVGARASAMGRALTAWGAPDAMFTNPAGLAEVRDRQVVVHHEPMLEGQQANAFSVLAHPWSVGTLALTYHLFDYGEEDARDHTGNTTGRLSTREQILLASFATVVHGGLTAGLNYKLYQFRLDCAGYCLGADFSGTTHALDAGLRLTTARLPHLRLGAAIMNLGFALQVINAPQADPLPARMKLGAAYELLHLFRPDVVLAQGDSSLADADGEAARPAVALWVTAEVEDRLRYRGSPEGAVGIELSLAQMLFVRAGYRTGEGRGTGAGTGIGFRYGRFSVDVSRTFAATGLPLDYEPFQLSVGVTF